jgi:hypothetical protein
MKLLYHNDKTYFAITMRDPAVIGREGYPSIFKLAVGVQRRFVIDGTANSTI